MAVTVLQTAGLSHSDTRGSRDMCSYPRLFAAYRVLHRLREPRHPPCALSYFLPSHRCNTNRTGQLILSAVASPPTIKEGREHARLILVIYSLACVNMSKILCPQGAGGECRNRADTAVIPRHACISYIQRDRREQEAQGMTKPSTTSKIRLEHP